MTFDPGSTKCNHKTLTTILNDKRQIQIGSALKFKTPPDAVIFPGAACPNEGETGQQKRCTVIREAHLMPPQNSSSKL